MGRKYCVFFIEVLPGSFSFKYKNYLFFFLHGKCLPFLEEGLGKINIPRNRIISPLFS